MVRSLSHSTKIRVRFSECDPLNIVWHGNYVKYFEDGRENFGVAHGFSYREIYSKNGLSIPMVHLEVDYKRPASFGEELSVETTLVDDPAAKVIFIYKILDTNHQVICTGKTIQVFMDAVKKELLITMPAFFEDWKATHLI